MAFTVDIVVVGSTVVFITYIELHTAKYIRHAHIHEAVGIQEGTFVVMFQTSVEAHQLNFTCLIAQF